MSDLDDKKKTNRKERSKESTQAIGQDDTDRRNDQEAFMKKFQYLKTFRDGNKDVGFQLIFRYFNSDYYFSYLRETFLKWSIEHI